MKVPWFAVLLLPVLALTLVARSSAQTAMLVDAPNPAVESRSSLPPGDPVNGAMGVYAVQTPAAEAPRMNAMDWSLIGAAATLRVLDYTSTESAMARPQLFHEGMLPQKLVNNKAAFAAFEADMVGINYLGYRLLVRHHMRSLALVSQYVYVGAMTFQVAHNYQLLGNAPATQ
jgi:hypothetical protein